MFEKPTYEEYEKATAFARFRYKYGLIVTTLACLLLILLIFYVYSYGEELASNPLSYSAREYSSGEYIINGEKMNGSIYCACYNNGMVFVASNGTDRYYGDQAAGEFVIGNSGIKLQKEMIHGDFGYIEGLE